MGVLSIVIADDHALFRMGLRSLLDLKEEVKVVGEVDRIDDLPPLLRQTPSDLLLLDLQMERNALVDIETLASLTRVIVVTASEHLDDSLTALRSGANGIVFKRFAIETLMDAIRAVAQGHAWVPAELQGYLTAHLRDQAPEPLSTREQEIVRYVALGLRNAEVGRKLFISEVTVKSHLNNIFRKLRLRDRAELVRYAIRIGIVGVHEEVP